MVDSALLGQSRIVRFNLNKPQFKALTVMANETWLPWARGTGKTQGVIAPWILHKVENMPRSNGGLIGKSFVDIETKILQPIFLSFSMLGLEKDEHYCYGKKPPEHWEKPLTPIIDYSRVLSFPNGTTMELISLSLKGSANGKSLQWIVADEAKLLDENQLREEVFPILRGHVRHFGKSPWYGAKLFVTDKLSPSIHWILAKKKLMDAELVGAVIFFQLKMNEEIAKLESVAESTAVKIRRKIRKLGRLLATMRKNLVYYGEAKAKDNIANLSPSYFDNMARSLTAYEYSISIENDDPTRAENGFYGSRTETHLHNSYLDEDFTKPLAVALDYQASISPLVVAQINDLVIPGVKTLNFIRDFYVKQPLGLKHVVDEFCTYYQFRPCKEVYYFYDHTAVGQRNMHKKFCEEVRQFFEDNGWIVTSIYMGAAPLQSVKYSRINNLFENENSSPYPIRIHKNNCATMVLSMDQTATTESPTQGTGKDKTAEKNKNMPQEQTTHFSDTFDQIVWAVEEQNLYPMGEEYIGAVAFR